MQQALSSAQVLPVRVATLGIDLTLDQAALGLAMPDGKLPIDIPRGWQVKVERAAKLTRSGSCEAGSLLLTEPTQGKRWRVAIKRISCEVEVLALDQDGA